MPQPRKRANAPPRRFDPDEEARVVLILAVLSAAGPFVVLGLGPLVRGATALATWEKVALVGWTPLVALMALALFARSSGARARPAGRSGAVLAGASLALGLASAVAILLGGR